MAVDEERALPAHRTVTIRQRVTADDVRKLHQLAALMGRTPSSVVRLLIQREYELRKATLEPPPKPRRRRSGS